MIKRLLPLLMSSMLVGCASYEKRTYDISVKNETNEPITIWLTKNGEKYEEGWKAPEDMAAETPRNNRLIAGALVPPGKTATTVQSGEFASNTSAILRVYLGDLPINEILAISRGSDRRTDVHLYPGKSDWTVFMQGGKLLIEGAR